MRTDILTPESVEVVTPELGVEAIELLLAAEKVLAAERCASNLGAVAIICVGCPMLEFCRLKDEAVQDIQEQQITFEMSGELSLDDSPTRSIDSGGVIKVETSSVDKPKNADITQAHPDIAPVPKHPSYREQLLDDKIDFVLAKGLLASDEAGSIAFDHEQHSPITSNTTNQTVSSKASIEVSQNAIISVDGSPDSHKEASSQVKVKKVKVEPVDVRPIVTTEEAILPTASLRRSEQSGSDIQPSQEVKPTRIDNEQSETILTATPTKIAFTATAVKETVLTSITPDEVVFRPEYIVLTPNLSPISALVEPNVTEETISEIIILDTTPLVENELEVDIPHDSDSVAEYIPTTDSDEAVVEVRRFDEVEEDEATTAQTIVATPLIDSDSIDPEMRLSDIVSVSQRAIAVLRQLALRALRASTTT